MPTVCIQQPAHELNLTAMYMGHQTEMTTTAALHLRLTGKINESDAK